MSFLGLPPNIARLKEKGEIEKLIEALEFRLSDSPKGAPVREAAAQALGELKAAEAIAPLFKLAKADTQSVPVRLAVVAALLRIGGRNALKALIGLLPTLDHTRENAAYRDAVIKALARFGTAASDPLLAALQTNNPTVQTAAAEALARIGEVRAARIMVRLCENTTSAEVYHRVSDALYRFQNPAVVPELIVTLHEEATGRNAHLNLNDHVARTALERMTKMMFGNDARAWAAWWDEEGQARMLGDGESQ